MVRKNEVNCFYAICGREKWREKKKRVKRKDQREKKKE